MKTAMLLAAGRGERLRPLTDHRPKAMCPVKGKPLIEHHIEKLACSGFQRIVINHAWLGDQIRHHLGDGKKWNVNIHYSAEPPGGLETGGGIVQALPLLGNMPFLTVNADVFTDFDYRNVHLPANRFIHLVLVKNPLHNPEGDFPLLPALKPRYTFSGIACYHPSVFKCLNPGRFSVTPLLKSGIQKGQVSTELYPGLWIDTGSPQNLALAQSS